MSALTKGAKNHMQGNHLMRNAIVVVATGALRMSCDDHNVLCTNNGDLIDESIFSILEMP